MIDFSLLNDRSVSPPVDYGPTNLLTQMNAKPPTSDQMGSTTTPPTGSNPSFGDSLARILLGGNEGSYDSATRSRKASKRAKAGNAAASMASDPAAAAAGFMGPQSGGGSSFAETLGKILSVFHGL